MVFDEKYSNEGLYYPRPSGMLIDYLAGLNNPGEAIDLGCGDGRNSLWLLENGYRVTAIDTSSVGLEKLKGFATDRNIRHSLVTRLESVIDIDIPSACFDLVVASTLLCHLSRSDADSILGRAKAALRPGGLLYLSAFTVDDPSYLGELEVSETSAAVVNHFERNGVLMALLPLTVVRYTEGREWDRSHGTPHIHGIARGIARLD